MTTNMEENTVCLEIEKVNGEVKTRVDDLRPEYEEGDTIERLTMDEYFDLINQVDSDKIHLGVQELPNDRKVLHIFIEEEALEEL